ncbi:cyclic nucleotide-binding domain-containing protein [Microvirga sp. 17 mud 1-3]|uniref:cyclic nucleotide-binding domain-containing protein n=1 Tax=Microvirga sp. 17 mud 1-3 TaxID=2082949 RepID=UPI000D6BC028|nr:mechanosensitive ion channel family protein [Microvirga sp. 17 mud 1-3]AWM85522.1 small mechanosensitive ion channel [Microvirga sp. 17 mud 1-3]
MSITTVLADPAVQLFSLGITGIVVWHLIPRALANERMLAQLAIFSVMTFVLVHAHLAPLTYADGGTQDANAILLTSAKILWWVHLAWAIIGIVRLYLVLNGRPREARLIQDLIVGVVYLGMGLSVLAFVFGAPIGTLVATSGVVAIILGLALQNTLSDVFSGIALTLGRPYALGDWIHLSDGTEGRVIESTWRSTQVLTAESNIVVLPNSVLAKLCLTNVSRPTEMHRMSVIVRIAPTRMPSVACDVMRVVLASSSEALKEPAPLVSLRTLDAAALEIELQFWVAGISKRIAAKNEIFDLVYRHCKSRGLLLATPSDALVAVRELPTEESAVLPPVTPLQLIKALPIFQSLGLDEKKALAEAAVVREFSSGEVIACLNKPATNLTIVRSGVVSIRRDHKELRRLAPGDYYGGSGLFTDTEEDCTLEALEDVIVYEIKQQALATLLAERPALARILTSALSRQWQRSSPNSDQTTSGTHGSRALLSAIQSIFRS